MKPICVPCQRFFTCRKNEYPFIESMPIDDDEEALPGDVEPAHWEPYKLWVGDRWECAGCGASIIVGVASQPLAVHYQPEFQAAVASWKPKLRVNDC